MGRRCLLLPLLLSGLLVAGGCGDGVQPPADGDHEGSPAVSPAGADASGPITVHLSSPPTATISASNDRQMGGPLARALRLRHPDIGLDPCLWRAAEGYAEAAASTAAELPLAFTEFVIHWAGCPDPTAAVSTLLTDSDDHEPLLEHVAGILGDGGFSHLGVGRVRDRDYRWRWQVVLVNRAAELRPVPASAEPGQRLPLQFRVAERFTGAAIYSTSPRGRVERTEVGLGGGWAVASIELADEIGRQWIELLAEGPRGPEVLALFPVEIGRQPTSVWVGNPNPDESWITTPEEAEARVIELVNRDREAYGLPALTLDQRLSVIARAHSTDMAEQGFFAHVSPSSGDISDRLRARGVPTSLAMENLAKSPTLAEAQEGLMRSPGHRTAILSRDITHMGAGVVHDDATDMYLVTQIFAAEVQRSTPEELERDLEEMIRSARDHLRSPVLFHPDLSTTARYVARILASEEMDVPTFEALVADRMALTLGGGRSWSVVAGSCLTTADVELPESVASAKVDLIGLGAAAPASDRPTEPLHFVILLVY